MDPLSPQDREGPGKAIFTLVDEFFERRRSGEDLDPECFAAEHPELANELRAHLAGLPLIEVACSPGDDMARGESPEAGTELPTVEGFELLEQIGRGGMGVVYRAVQVSTKRVVALKVISGGPFASESARRRFDREVELAARLQHPSIVRVLESGEVARQRYYAMDHVAGVRLDRYLAKARPDVRTMLGILQRICEAVDYAHNHGVIHRDLKPGNVLIDEEGHPHILDFGLAKATDQADTEEAVTTCVSLPGQVLGTLYYLSPEQAAGTPDEIDARTDVYALGVVMFEALTGSLPFDTTGRPSQVIQRILETPPTRPSSLSKRMDDEIETIILKALEKDKARRYQSARDLADDIRRYLDGEPIAAKRPSSFYYLRKKLRKHRLAAGVCAVVALSLIGLLGLSWWQQPAAQDRFQRAIEEYARLGGKELQIAHARLHMKEYDSAVAFLSKVVESVDKEPSEERRIWVYCQHATALWLEGRRKEALKGYDRFLSQWSGPSYAHARKYLILRELHQGQEAEDVLEAALREFATQHNAKEKWLYQIFRCLDGQLTPGELVAYAHKRPDNQRLCEAYYYAGEICLLLDHRDDARKWFETCVEANLSFDEDTDLATPMFGYHLARQRLDTLFGSAPTPPAEEN